jgi:hypothetical protein
MKRHPLLLAACAAWAAMPALAVDLASSTASSASSAGSASLGSASDSLKASGNSSAGPRQMAEGDYRVVAVAEAAERPAQWRVTLQAPAGGAADTWELLLPRAVAEREGLAGGQTVRATQQPYGVAFARAGQAQPFFLMLAEDWQRELPARPVRAPSGG